MRLLRSVGLAVFVEYFDRFADSSLSNSDVAEMLPEEYSLMARRTRVSCARRIIARGLATEALDFISGSSNVDPSVASAAAQLIADYHPAGAQAVLPVSPAEDEEDIDALLVQVKSLARKYRNLTGRPLGCTGEVAELEAASLLGLRLADVRQAGYDAIGEDGRRIQIKGRCILPSSKPGQRIGSINCKHDWDTVMLVLLDEDLNATAMYEADRAAVVEALEAPGSRARNERGALGIPKFKSIGWAVWPV